MNRWKRKVDEEDDDTLTFDDLDDLDDGEDEDDPKPKRRPYLPPRPIRTHLSYEEGDFDEDDDSGQSRFDEIEAKIRSGSYKPTKSDPWNAHVLYDMLKSLGDVK